MDTNTIVSQLKLEVSRLNIAISALEGSSGDNAPRSTSHASRRTGRAPLSAAARKRISVAMKARWAARGTKAKSGTPAGSKRRRGGMSAAGRKRMSQMMKQRWVLRKAGKTAA